MKKRSLILIPMCIAAHISMAQVQYIPAAVHRFGIGLGGGVTALYGDATKVLYKPAAKMNLDYNFTPYFSAGMEGQYGKFAEGYQYTADGNSSLYSMGHFYAANANIRIGLGQVLKPTNNFTQLIGGIYVGSGVGIVSSEIEKIAGDITSENIVLKANEMVIPVNVGINADLPVYKLGINLNYQHNITQSDNLDGYNFKIKNNNNMDAYGFLSMSIRYYFGGVH